MSERKLNAQLEPEHSHHQNPKLSTAWCPALPKRCHAIANTSPRNFTDPSHEQAEEQPRGPRTDEDVQADTRTEDR